MNLIENLATKKRLFKDESVFELSYIPKQILYRNAELDLLSSIFHSVVEKPFYISRKVIIQGPVGVGKTLTTKVFINNLEQAIAIRNLNFKTFIINCRQSGTAHLILGHLLTGLGKKVKSRGMSPHELFEELVDTLKRQKIYLILVLDELHYINEGKFPLIYSLSRMTEYSGDGKQYISIIGIVRNISLVGNMDASTKSTLQENIITFRKYTNSEIYSILDQRINLGLVSNVVSKNSLEFITNIVGKSGDIRKGLNIIKNAVLIAESKNGSYIELEDIMNAFDPESESVSEHLFTNATSHKIASLLGLIRILKRKNDYKIYLDELETEISLVCSQYSIKKGDSALILFDLKSAQKAGFLNFGAENNLDLKTAVISLENPALLKFEALFQEQLKKMEKDGAKNN